MAGAGGTWSEALSEAENWPRRTGDRARIPETRPEWELVIDASDADSVAALHPEWLAAGLAVVTANKRGLGGEVGRAARILALWRRGAGYGASATVGAGLGAVERLVRMQAQGEQVLSIEGVLSGTLAFVLERVSEGQDLAGAVAEAQALGLAEPDPVEDLSGRDAARKLRILARVAGFAESGDSVRIDPQLAWPEGVAWPDAVGEVAARRMPPRRAAIAARSARRGRPRRAGWTLFRPRVVASAGSAGATPGS